MSGVPPYPLTWPDTIPRKAGSRESGQFKTALAGAMKNVQDSLRRFGTLSGKPVQNVVISSNVTLGVNRPADPGVAVWFTWEGQQVCIPVDRYASVEANVQAIHHVLEARCTELRHGTLALVRATMKGFVALPAPKSWREILSIDPDLQVDERTLETAWKIAARAAHPDRGGSHAKMSEVNEARDRAKRELNL